MGDEADARIAHLSGGWVTPDYDAAAHPADATALDATDADPETQAFHAEMDAAEIADRLAEALQAVLTRNGHTSCNLEHFASTTLREGATVVVCGCGEFWPAPELGAPTVDLAPERVEVHGPAAITVAAADPIARTLELIRPGEDYRPEQVERLMLDTTARLEEGQAFERWALEQAAEAKRAYDREYAKQFTLCSGPMELRRNVAEVNCAELADAADRTDMVYRAAKASMHNLRSVLSGYQSVLKSVQATYQVGGSPGGRAF